MKKEILKLIELGEGYHLEFKQSIDKSFIEEVCAFANSSGGQIFLGVKDNGEIFGIDTGNSYRSRVQDTIRQLEPNIENIKVTIEDNIIIVDVPQGVNKPYACSKGFFIRIGPNSQKLKRDEIINFFQKEGRIRFDELENTRANFEEDFNYNAFKNFIKSSGISDSIDQKFLLNNLDCITEKNNFTNAGVLFFSKSIEFYIPQATVVCVLYKGIEKIHIIDKKDFYGNIVENVEGALNFVKRHINLEFKIEKIQREEIYEIPEVALREAILNAVCHRDYFEKGANVLIEIFDNRVDITNPGGLPADLSPEEFGTKSITRNSIIASLLLRANYIEKVGTGINRIRDAVKNLGKGDVTFSYRNFFTVSFSRNKLFEKTVEKTVEKIVEKTVEKILKLITDNPHITIKQIEKKIGLTRRGVEWNIDKLKKNGVINRIGADKGGYWIICEKKNDKL